jgi:hypothetical protein
MHAFMIVVGRLQCGDWDRNEAPKQDACPQFGKKVQSTTHHL